METRNFFHLRNKDVTKVTGHEKASVCFQRASTVEAAS